MPSAITSCESRLERGCDERLDDAGVLLPAVLVDGLAQRFGAERVELRPIVQQGRNRCREGGRVARFDQQAGAALLDDLRDLADVRGDDRATGGHVLEDLERREVEAGLGV